MKRIFALFVVLFAVNGYGLDTRSVDGAGFNKLTEQQQADIIKQVADKAAENKAVIVPGAVTAEKVNQWVEVGQNIGKMFGGAAKEVGVAVNEFSQTDVGKWTMILIIWHYLGGAIVHVVSGLLVLLASILFVRYLINRQYTSDIEYNREVRNIFLNHPKVKVKRRPVDDGNAFWYAFLYVLAVGFSCAIMFTF